MKLTQFVVIGCVAMGAQGCAMLSAVRSGNPNAIKAAAEETARKKAQADANIEASCGHIKTDVVGYEEERAIGGAIAVSQFSGAGGVFLEGMTEKDPIALNEKLKNKEKITLPDNAVNELSAYVAVVGRNLTKYSTRPDIAWTFAVVQSDTPNAISAPGGYVVVTTGLLKKITNEAQLAGVLAHEIGHVVLKHSIIKYMDGKDKQCRLVRTMAEYPKVGLPLPPGASKGLDAFANKFDGQLDLDKEDGKFIVFLTNAIVQLMQLGNDINTEFAADAAALELVAFAGYDAVEYENFLSTLDNQHELIPNHPSTKDRVAKLKALREGELAPFCSGTAKPDVSKPFSALKPKS